MSISWPKEGSRLQNFLKAFQVFVLTDLATCNVILVYDRYFKNSTKTHERLQRQGREGISRVHVLTPDILSLPRAGILSVTENKQQMNVMLYESLLAPEFLSLTEQFEHKLTLCGIEDHPIDILKGTMIRRRDIISKHEEADLGIAQQAILSSLENQILSTVTDDTDIFALLAHLYVKHNCSKEMYMSSPKNHSRARSSAESIPENRVIDIKATATKYSHLCQYLLQLHALTEADTVASLFGIGKKKALNTIFNGTFNVEVLAPVGDINSNMSSVVSAPSQLYFCVFWKAVYGL